MHFNLSTSGNCCLIAVSGNLPVGVDVEELTPGPDVAGLANRFFNAAEAADLARLPDELRLAGFLRHWTSKEAQAKATGRGLSAGLTSFTVPPEALTQQFWPGSTRSTAGGRARRAVRPGCAGVGTEDI